MGHDYSRLGDAAESLVRFIDNRAYLRMLDGHCIALSMAPQTHRFECQVYSTRPDACRELARGSPACDAERLVKRDLVQISLGRR